jgi:hypothetical protein
MYIDRRSWMTLGEVPFDPIDQIETIPGVTAKYNYLLHRTASYMSVRNGLRSDNFCIIQYSYSKKKDRYFATTTKTQTA